MDINCPDGMDCAWWPHCQDTKTEDEPCPLLDTDTDPTKPIDKLIEESLDDWS